MSKLTEEEMAVFKKIGRKGGIARKKQKPDYKEIGRKGGVARWAKEKTSDLDK